MFFTLTLIIPDKPPKVAPKRISHSIEIVKTFVFVNTANKINVTSVIIVPVIIPFKSPFSPLILQKQPINTDKIFISWLTGFIAWFGILKILINKANTHTKNNVKINDIKRAWIIERKKLLLNKIKPPKILNSILWEFY